MEKTKLMIFVALVALAILVVPSVSAVPGGGDTTSSNNETGQPAAAEAVNATGGQITNLDIDGDSQTTRWQGFYGDVTGEIILEDDTSNLLFNWTWTNTGIGEVYAANESSVSWADVVAGTAYLEDVNAFFGMSDASDNITETFANNDASFTVGTNSIGSVPRLYTRDNGGWQNSVYLEGLLFDPTNYAVVLATDIESTALDFKAGSSDFQMIVPTPGAGSALYYFWVELS